MKTNWAELRQEIAADRGGCCFMCDIAPWEELHHCLVHRMRDRPELDVIENLMPVCRDCHPYANGYKTRRRFWRSQCELYGTDRMREWLAKLNLKIPPIFE